mmetsp:Transcript_104817/g.321049  ORF Transcript_104817/g.321049 Transcript_104817/m.321049 type:complete len:392 (+) Transcript_104817:939-2114(+)
MSVASLIKRWATNLCSCSRRALVIVSRSLRASSTTSFILAKSLAAASSADALPFASCWRSPMSLDAACTACRADEAAAPAFSQAPFIASGARSPPSVSSAVDSFAALTSSFISPSFASSSFLTTSCFRLAADALRSASFLLPASTRSCSLTKASAPMSAAAWRSLLMASRFIWMYVLAPANACPASCRAFVSASRAAWACSVGSDSSPMRKGASASDAFLTHASASFIFCSDSSTIRWTSAFCFKSLILSSAPFNLSVAASRRGRSLCASALAAAWRFWMSARCAESFRSASALSASAASAAPTASAAGASPSSATLATAASAWASPAATFCRASSRARIAWMRSPTEATSFLYFVSSPCAVLILALYLMSSALTSAEASLLLDSNCLAWM